MKPKCVMVVCGARPNFMKVAPVLAAFRAYPEIKPCLVHTGQHYDEAMSGSFFETLGIPAPDIHLGVGSGSHAEQTARIMVEFEKACLDRKPDLVMVVGDVNSTLACAIVAKKLWVPVAHVEAGLRSGDQRMPEEINRIVTDSITDIFFTTDPEGDANLKKAGVDPARIIAAGNVMIDSLLRNRAAAAASAAALLEENGLAPRGYCALTLHRPSNVDDQAVFSRLVSVIETVQARLPVVFPAHPRTLKNAERFGLKGRLEAMKGLRVLPPLDYHKMLRLTDNARFVMTDSGGLQEETTVLGVPCITLRESTERPVTAVVGTNEVVGTDPAAILDAVERVLAGRWKKGGIPPGWDGRAGERIAAATADFLRGTGVRQA